MNQSAVAKKILVVEDEPRLANVLRDYLHSAGYETQWVADGAQVISAFENFSPSLVLLDLMLPHIDGFTLCKELRQISNVAIIMVTARIEEIDRLLGLEVGADDYICKPFSPREVVARVAAVLRRFHHSDQRHKDILLIDENSLTAELKGNKLDLTPIEYRLLSTLAFSTSRVWSRSELMDHLYSDNRIVSDRTVDSHIKNLRRKLMDAGCEDEPIRSVYGIGYSLDLSIQKIT